MDYDLPLCLKYLLGGHGGDQAKLTVHVNSIMKPISLYDTLQMKFYSMVLLLVSEQASLEVPTKGKGSDVNQGGKKSLRMRQVMSVVIFRHS